MSSEVEPLLHSCTNCAALLDVSEQEPFSEIHCPSCGTKMRCRTKFDHFELIEMIASGGMGTVYRARDVNLNRIVALKLLRKEFSVDQDYIEKLETEAKITASVSHPHVVKVFSFGCDQGLYYIAMELVDKGSFDDLMSLQGRIAEVQVLEVGIQVAQGLRAAVQAGLIHRDVKPGNILFADAHTAKIVDFGLAMPLEQARDADEEIWGTPYYVAPEKLNHDPEDFRSDIYSLGGTLFHALAGRPPFEAVNASLVALKHIKSQVVSLQAFAPDISSPTSYVINRTLAKNPDERYQSYDELIEHLEYARTKLLENTGKPRQPKARVVVEGEEQQKILGYILMGVIAFVIILGGVLFVFKDSIVARHMSSAERERARLMKTSGTPEEVYSNARRLIVEGEPQSAVPLLWQLEQRPNLPQPLKNWILLHEGIADYLSGLATQGNETFARLGDGGIFTTRQEDRRLANFFPEVARLVTRNSPIRATVAPDYTTEEFEPLGLFIFGLREWEANRFEESVALFNAFLATAPAGQWEWINSYKPIAQRYIDDYEVTKGLKAEVAAADTPQKKTALIQRLEEIRLNLQLPGNLPQQLANYSRSLQGGLRPASGREATVPVAALRDQTLRLIRDFQPEQARKMIESASMSSADEEIRSALFKRAFYIVEFKKRLIDDLNSKGYSESAIERKSGKAVSGKVEKASEFRIEVKGPNEMTSILWTDLPPAAISKIASSFITVRAGSIPGDEDVERLWLLGCYEAMTGNRKEAISHLMRGAEYKREYARDLVLFDNPTR